MHLLPVFVLGLVYSATARNCLQPTDLENFDFVKYEGAWHEVGYRTGNASLVNEFRKIKCVDLEFTANGNRFDVKADYLLDGKKTEKRGKYTLLENKKSAFALDYVDSPLYSEYIYRIVCTDYASYSVGYSCSQLQEGKSSDVIFLNARDRSKYQELLAKEDVKKCLRDQLRARPERIKPIPQNDC